MAKRTNTYRLYLEPVSLSKEDTPLPAPLQIQFNNHDEIFEIIERIKAKALFENEGDATEFAIGLKLFSEVMIRNRNHPLFAELAPHFSEFMKKLKSF